MNFKTFRLSIGNKVLHLDSEKVIQMAREMEMDCVWDKYGRAYITEKRRHKEEVKRTDHGEELIEINF